MTPLFEKSIETLELPRVLALLNKPVEHVPHFTRRRPDVPPDVGQLRRGRVGDLILAQDGAGDLNTRELLDIAQVLRCARSVREYGGGGEGKTVLDGYF